MRIKLTHVTSLLATGAAAVAMVAAPLPKTCVGKGPGPTSRSAVKVELASPGPEVCLFPSGTMPYLLGGH